MAEVALTHAQRVTRLYRLCLRHSLSWIVERDKWRREAMCIRARFDANKDIKNLTVANQLYEEALKEFNKFKHPHPYVHPSSPEGTKYERNLPPPPHVLKLTPEEEEWVKEIETW